MAKKRTRAPNGMGSIRQRKDGKWEGRYTAPDGRQKSVYGKSEKEVTQKLRGVLHEIDSGAWREPSRMTVNDWLDIWLRDYQGHTTGRTVTTYTGSVNNYVRPVIGAIKMGKLKPMHIMRVLSEMQSKGLSPTTQRQACAILNNAMRAAIIAGVIRENPVENVKRPRKQTYQFMIIDRQQIPDFIEAALQTDFPYEILLLLYTGLRVGELRGLRWDDVDLDGSKLTIERQLYAASHQIGFGPPKQGETRTIQLPAEAVDVLKKQKKRQAEQRLAAGDKWREDDLSKGLIFRQRLGQIHTSVSIARAVKTAGDAIGINDLHPHDLRHSYAVAALRSGADVKTVQHNLGHRSASVTLDVYAAYTTDAGKEGARKLSEYLKNANSDG